MAKTLALVLGVVLLAVGVVGWFTGGHDHTLLNLFGINMTHNIVHLLTGAVGLVAALNSEKSSKLFLLVFGAVYAVVALAGFLNVDMAVSLLNLNTPDNFLHLAIAAACLGVGLQSKAA